MGRVSIGDVAHEAGVSRAAVSYALRDDANIAAETRAMIRKVADALGYRPDPVLARLMAHLHAGRGRRYAGKMAFVNVNEDNDFWRRTPALADFRRSAERRAGELGYGTEEFWFYEPGRSPRRLAQMLAARGIRGLVIGSTARRDSELVFPWAKFAAVTVGYSVARPALHRVATHHYRNTRLALRRAEALGYSKFGFIAGRETESFMDDLHLAAFLAHQQETPARRRVPPLWWDGGDGAALRRWFDRHRPEVILSAGPGVAELAAAGLRVPEEAGLAKLLLWDSDAGTAGVRPGYERLGAAAINLLAGQLQHGVPGVPEDTQIVQVEGRWTDGASLPAREAT